MYHILLSLIAIGAPLDCDHASELIDSARNNPDKSEQLEIVRVVIAHTDPVCFKDAQVDLRNGLINLILQEKLKWHKSLIVVLSTTLTQKDLSNQTRSI